MARPTGAQCVAPTDESKQFAPVLVGQSAAEMATVDMATTAMQQAVSQSSAGPVTVHVLSLSSGGQYGAFGAGFLRGWSENPVTPRPDFDLVTGVSTGGLLAPVAFAGAAFDPILDTYRGIAQADVYRNYPPLTIPFRPSVASTAPLQRLINNQLSDELIDTIAARHTNEGAQLLVSAANLDTTENRIFNLTDVASSPTSAAMRRNCLTEVLLASAAVPGLFAPRQIGGELYADGGLRDHVFFRAVESARAQVARDTGRDLRVEASVIVNGALRRPGSPAPDTLTGYFARSAEILADEVLRDSIAETVAFAQGRPHWRIKGVFAEVDLTAAGCAASQASGTIDPCVTTALFDAGRTLAATAPINWKSAQDLRQKAGEL
ncbi:patatin-like phospholipase family protein [Yoonia sp. SS1-5]|uniref:Patatin-like phospholipase family protein n=1 Tax=Yoonia rhodophyticola TaxID=3137370 RepID=A0AAN0MB68_9RHOB